MEKICITHCGGQPIICKITKDEEFYLEGELLYPFAGVEFDYFNENDGLTATDVYLDPKPVIHGLYRVYETVVKNKERILDKAAPLQQPVRSMAASLLRQKYRLDYAIATLDDLEINSNDLHYLSKRAATRLAESITDLIGQKEFDFVSHQGKNYEHELERIISENDYVKDLDKNTVLKETILWVENLQANPEYTYIRFKTMQTRYPDLKMPGHPYNDVGEFEFLMDRGGHMALFIGSQFGLDPLLTDEYYRKLDGQKIAILFKDLLSGHVAGLGIYEVKNGDKIQIAYFKNEKISEEKL